MLDGRYNKKHDDQGLAIVFFISTGEDVSWTDTSKKLSLRRLKTTKYGVERFEFEIKDDFIGMEVLTLT